MEVPGKLHDGFSEVLASYLLECLFAAPKVSSGRKRRLSRENPPPYSLKAQPQRSFLFREVYLGEGGPIEGTSCVEVVLAE